MFFKPILENTNNDRVDLTVAADQYMSLRVEGLNLTSTIGTIFYAEMVCRRYPFNQLL